MTQQYLLGELSLILGELQAVATNEAAVGEIARLRQESETGHLHRCRLWRGARWS